MRQIVIDIDDGIYDGIVDGNGDMPRNIVRSFQATIADAIKNGTPLPKGHGRLIDEGQIPGDGGWDFSDRLAETPTIIEADKQEGN